MSHRPEEATALERALGRRSIALTLYALLSVVLTLPLALRFRSAVPAGSGDILQNYWNFWWWKTALFDLQVHPYRTEYQFHPFGVDLVFYTHSIFNQLVAMPVNLKWGEAAAYNFCVLLALALCGYGAYLLACEITGDPRASFLAGLVYTFFPQHLEQLTEHLNLIAAQFLPWALYFVLRVARRGGTGAWLGLAATFTLNALCSWHLGIMLCLSAAAVLPFELRRTTRSRAAVVRDLAFALSLSGVLLWPAVQPLAQEILAGQTYFQKPEVPRGVDLAYLFIPPFGQPIWGRLFAGAYVERAYEAAGFVTYLGFFPLALAALAWRRRERGVKFWTAFAIGMTILALGDRPWAAGTRLEWLPLPFSLFHYLPFLDVLNVANRFMILASLGLGMLVAFGWRSLAVRTDRRFLLVAGLLLLDYAWLPFPMREMGPSPAYVEMVQDPIMRVGAVLDIPFHQRSRTALNMVAQTYHGRPIGGGYHSTYPPATLGALAADPVLSKLADVPTVDGPIDFDHLIRLGFDTVVLHKYRRDSAGKAAVARTPPKDIMSWKRAKRMGGVPDETYDEIRRQLIAACGPPAFEDDEVEIFYLKSGDSDGEDAIPMKR